jgi:hypothetical protein
MLVVKFLLAWEVLPESSLLPVKELLIISFFLFCGLNINFHFVFVLPNVPVVVFEIEIDLGFESLL